MSVKTIVAGAVVALGAFAVSVPAFAQPVAPSANTAQSNPAVNQSQGLDAGNPKTPNAAGSKERHIVHHRMTRHHMHHHHVRHHTKKHHTKKHHAMKHHMTHKASQPAQTQSMSPAQH